MRLSGLGFASLLVLAACGGKEEEEAATAEASGKDAAARTGSIAAAARDVRIRPGLWRVVRVEMGGQPQTDQECVTPEEATLDASDFTEAAEGCTQSGGAQGGAFVYRVSCPANPSVPGMGPSEMEFRIRTQGETRYSGTVSMTMQLPGQPKPQTYTSQLEGVWVGPCPAGGEAAE